MKDGCFKLLSDYQKHKRRLFLGGLGVFLHPVYYWDWVAGAGSQQAALGGCSLALIKLGRRWKAKTASMLARGTKGRGLLAQGARMSPLPRPGAPRDNSIKCWLWNCFFHSTSGVYVGQVPVPSCAQLWCLTPVLPLVPQEISLGCKTDHCRLQSLSASKWPSPYLENHG